MGRSEGSRPISFSATKSNPRESRNFKSRGQGKTDLSWATRQASNTVDKRKDGTQTITSPSCSGELTTKVGTKEAGQEKEVIDYLDTEPRARERRESKANRPGTHDAESGR